MTCPWLKPAPPWTSACVQCTIVGKVVSLSENATRATAVVHDGSASIEVVVFLQDENAEAVRAPAS